MGLPQRPQVCGRDRVRPDKNPGLPLLVAEVSPERLAIAVVKRVILSADDYQAGREMDPLPLVAAVAMVAVVAVITVVSVLIVFGAWNSVHGNASVGRTADPRTYTADSVLGRACNISAGSHYVFRRHLRDENLVTSPVSGY